MICGSYIFSFVGFTFLGGSAFTMSWGGALVASIGYSFMFSLFVVRAYACLPLDAFSSDDYPTVPNKQVATTAAAEEDYYPPK